MRMVLVNAWPTGTFEHMRFLSFYRTRRAIALRVTRFLFVVEW